MFHLRRIGDAYANETINPSNGLRQELLGALEEKLAAAIRLLDEAKAEQGPEVATPSPMGQGRVRSLVQFHEQAQAYSGDDLLVLNPKFSDPSLTVGSKLQGEYFYDIPGL